MELVLDVNEVLPDVLDLGVERLEMFVEVLENGGVDVVPGVGRRVLDELEFVREDDEVLYGVENAFVDQVVQRRNRRIQEVIQQRQSLILQELGDQNRKLLILVPSENVRILVEDKLVDVFPVNVADFNKQLVVVVPVQVPDVVVHSQNRLLQEQRVVLNHADVLRH